MSDVVYRSEVRIKCIKGPFVTAYLPAEPEPFIFGLRGAVARALPRSRNPRYNARLHCRRCARATGGFRMSLFGLEPRSHVSAADHECIVLLYTSFCRQSFISRSRKRRTRTTARLTECRQLSALVCCSSRYSFRLRWRFF